MRIKNIRQSVPCGWIYKDQASGTEFKERIYEVLVENVTRFYGTTKLRSEVESLIHEYICSLIPPGRCTGDIRVPKKRLTLDDLMTGTRALIDIALGSYCDIDEAIRRSNVCILCVNNINTYGCWSCVGARNIARKVIRRRLPNENRLLSCGICSCALIALVSATDETLLRAKGKTIGEYPENCWLKGVLSDK